MNSILVSVLSFLVAIGVLITVHEFGHFWVARRLGIKVLRFSIGFGKPLWSRRGRVDDTEFVVAAIPLGGYVKMLDEHEGEVEPSEVHRAFNRQKLWKRTAVVAAGPVFNFLFAIVAYSAVFLGGVEGTRPIVGEVAPSSVAEASGLQPRDEFKSIDGVNTPTWDTATLALLDGTMEGKVVNVEVVRNGNLRLLNIDLTQAAALLEGGFILETLGVQPWRPDFEPIVDGVVEGGPAEKGGLAAGDTIVTANGEYVGSWRQWVNIVQVNPNKEIQITVNRNEKRIDLAVVPRRIERGGKTIGQIGAYVRVPEELISATRVEVKYGPIEAMGAALGKTYDMSLLMLRMLGKMITGQASIENLSGPISIAQYAGQSASIGFVPFVLFLAIISISLGVINLLPVPLLDGGHLFYYLIEFVKGSPLSEAAQLLGQKIGIATILLLMGLAFYNDLARLLG